MLVLFAVALTVFVLPFAFPTPPPIVTRFQSTLLFSPNGDGRREEAQVTVRLRVPSRVSLEVQRDGRAVRRLVAGGEQPAGLLQVAWDGRDASGARVPDGTYAFKLDARAGRRKFRTPRKVIVDTDLPAIARYTVRSTSLAGEAGAASCRVSVIPADPGSLTIEALGPRGGRVQALGPRPARKGKAAGWAWRALTHRGEPVPPGLYVLRATLADAARNLVRVSRSCWVGRLTGTALPRLPTPGGQVGVALRGPDGKALPGGTSVHLVLYERVGTPGRGLGPVLGERVGLDATGPIDLTRVTIPFDADPADLWLVAGSGDGLALIPLGGTP
ncbi:MAG: hypothetical protein QOD86_2736 [Miltoncostaeaceae bacterium]|jgi:hypothetical protein|nr:hypothetical protein [Miltoncostaeaceae bacterium]